MQTLTALVFDDFETLDLFGPIELFGSLPNDFRIQFASMKGGIIITIMVLPYKLSQ